MFRGDIICGCAVPTLFLFLVENGVELIANKI